MAAGLPPKPYVPPTAPAPPLPAGPAPQQPAYNAQDPAAAHAAAWAAYYQSQGLTAQGQPQAAAGYAAQPQAGPQQPAGASSNPYANYGYGAQAAQAHLHGGPTAAPGHRPPANVAPQQGYQYNQQQGYASPAPYQQAGPTQGYAGPGAGGYSQPQQGYQAWGQQGGGPGPQQQQAYRPPQGQTYQQGPPGVGPQQPYFNGPGSGPGQQPYTPPHSGGQTPYRHNPSHSPAPMGMSQNRPYQPQPMSGPQSRGPRPPMNQNQGPTPPHHPPAKRPRFDGPGPGPGGGPTHLGGPGRASLPVRPGTGSIPARPPSGPRTPLPPPPITRPPIHLGTGGPPPVFAPGGPRNNAGPMRGGGERGRGRGGMVMNAPRGPSHMRRERQDHQRQRSARSEVSPGKKDSRKDKKKEKEAKTTLTDFRIVGIEMKELGWKWGLVGEEAMNQAEEDEEKAEKIEAEVKTEDVDGEGAASGAAPTAAEPAEAEVKEEIVQSETVNQKETDKTTEPETTADPTIELIEQSVKEEPSAPLEGPEGKTGGKRKAQTPETDEGSSKKRSTYLLTHGKANDAPSHESSQNRFRIYFESPPEADRIPQALRRNPYKRWRREDSAAPASAPAAEEGKKETEGDLPAIEEVGATQEAPTQESSEKVDEAGENAAQNGDVVDQTTETAVPETTEIPSDTLVIEAAEAPTEAEAIPVVDESETIAPVEDAQPEAASAGTTDSGEPAPVPDVVVETDVEVPATAAEQAPVDTEPPKEDELPVPAPAETDSAAAVDAPTSDETPTAVAAPTTATAEETATAIAQSAENAASAYKSRTRRRSSVSSTDSRETQNAFQPEVTPSLNRLSILYEGSQRRMCFDADVVEMIKVYRAEGRIEVCFAPAVKPEPKEGEDDAENVASTSTLLPKGYLLEEYNQEDQRFAPVSRERLQELYAADESSDSIPPLHRHFTDSPNATGLQLSVYLNKKNPLSVPRWCRNNSADEWLYEQFGSRHDGWRSKLQVMDPDPPPTLSSILENWSTSSSSGTSHKRSAFTKSLISEPYDLLEILLRLTRGDRNPTAPGGQGGPLATSIRSDSPYASHQTHVSLAILAMYRLTTDYAEKAGEKSEVVNEKIGDIIKSLPGGMISRSLDGMFKEWDGRGKGGK